MTRYLSVACLGGLALCALGWLAGAALRRSSRPGIAPPPAQRGATAPPATAGSAEGTVPARPRRSSVPLLGAEELLRLAEREDAWW
jgi:hypothetical protein